MLEELVQCFFFFSLSPFSVFPLSPLLRGEGRGEGCFNKHTIRG
jgi:hypothetical protein